MNKIALMFSTRPKAHEVFDDMKIDDSEVILDFSGVQKATPSFLHETLLLFGKRGIKKIDMTNMSESLSFQLEKAKQAL